LWLATPTTPGGKLISTTGSLASTIGVKNPYRYRGYRYDTETGLYYLQSRFYNPDWGRFVNADGLTGVDGELLTHNMFAYCINNPINKDDPTGFIATDGLSTINPKTPPPKETGFVPPKSKNKGSRRIPAPGARGETGWLDNKGRVWVPDFDMDGGEGWRRHYPDGHHDHVYPNGKIRSHNVMTIQYQLNSVKSKVRNGVITLGIGYLLYRGIRVLPSLLPVMWPTLPANIVLP